MRRYLFITLTILILCFTANAQKTENFRYVEKPHKSIMDMSDIERKIFIESELYRLRDEERRKKQLEIKVQRSLA